MILFLSTYLKTFQFKQIISMKTWVAKKKNDNMMIYFQLEYKFLSMRTIHWKIYIYIYIFVQEYID